MPDCRIHHLFSTGLIEVDFVGHPWVIPVLLSSSALHILGDCSSLILVHGDFRQLSPFRACLISETSRGGQTSTDKGDVARCAGRYSAQKNAVGPADPRS